MAAGPPPLLRLHHGAPAPAPVILTASRLPAAALPELPPAKALCLAIGSLAATDLSSAVKRVKLGDGASDEPHVSPTKKPGVGGTTPMIVSAPTSTPTETSLTMDAHRTPLITGLTEGEQGEVVASMKEVLPSQSEVIPAPKAVLPSSKEVLPSPKDVLPSPKEVLSSPTEARSSDMVDMVGSDANRPHVAADASMGLNTPIESVEEVHPADQLIGDPDAPTKRQKRKDSSGRPRSSPAKKQKVSGPTRLRKGRAVASAVPMDVWEMVLAYCPGKFLAKARRINSAFQRALSYESVWKKNRLQVHGPELPDPFPDMREDEYANLREGLGCMECGNKKTRKTYWPWRKRWCADCLHKNTVKVSGFLFPWQETSSKRCWAVQEDAAMSLLQGHRDLLDSCIPYGFVDSWGNYEMAGEYARNWTRQGHGRQKIYSKKDIKEILRDWEAFLADGPKQSEDSVERWRQAKKTARDEAMERIQKIENWVETKSRGKITENAQLKMQRAEYFKERAAELDPPIVPEALALIQAYKRAIDIPKAPSHRAWKALAPKLEVDREAAQAAVELQRRRASRDDRDKVEQAEYLARMTRRAEGHTAEQRTLGMIADDVLAGLRRASPAVADADFGLLALRLVREKYHEEGGGREVGPDEYALVLDDAKWVWEKKIVPVIDGWGTARSRVGKAFKCPGCARNDINLRYTFDALFCHLRRKHSVALGDFHSLFREGLEAITNFHWLDIEWPVHLPILADHHVATGKWDPNDRSPYVRAPAVDPEAFTRSAYQGRRVQAGVDGADGVIRNIIRVGSALHGIGLDPAVKTSVAIKYAALTYEFHHGSALPSDVSCIVQLPLGLIRAGVYDLFDHFRCAVCLERSGPPRGMTKLHSPQTLLDHFRRWHTPDRSWHEDMMRLPDEVEIWRALNKPGMEEALHIFDSLFPRGVDLGLGRRPRAQAGHA
ncbi:MAG: hypothetical protein M1832_000393 [Thelocarpon impressellum]|nr:MAG: hypothetical protein M1832_000393 [Thelocarpon impressellum]